MLPTVLQADPPGQASRTSGTNIGATPGTTDWLTGVCREAEAAGAAALWAVDHLFWGQPVLEATTALTVAAAATARATIGTCVLQLPLRSPAAVAKQAATLQLLSEGRFVLGVGSGSHPGEYAAAGAGQVFGRRGRKLDEGIAAVRAAWSSGDQSTSFYRQEPVPRPVPIWIGGSTAAARRRAATLGDGWVPLFVGPEDLADGVDRLRAETEVAGRDPREVTVAVVVMVAVGDDAATHQRGTRWLSSLYGIPPKAFDRHLVSGSPARCAEALGRFAEAGAQHAVVMVAGDDAVAQFARLAEAAGSIGRRPATDFDTGPGRTDRPRPEAMTEVLA